MLMIKRQLQALKRATNNFAIKIKNSPIFLISSKASMTFSFSGSFNPRNILTFFLVFLESAKV